MKTIRVVAAVIKAENEKGQPVIFATQRGYGELKGGRSSLHFNKNTLIISLLRMKEIQRQIAHL